MTKKIPSPITPKQSLEAESPAVAIIGGGYWGKNLVRNFYNLNSLKLVCDKNETILSNYKDQYKDIETCLALTDVLSNKAIQGVVIATPAETHFNIARESLLAGKHVNKAEPERVDIAQEEPLRQECRHFLRLYDQWHPTDYRRARRLKGT